jgi:hypothetical protein
MARRIRAAGLETRSHRLKLPVAKKPIFIKVALGVGLGYRRNASGGTWVVRVSDGRGGNWTKGIGTADDYAEADGKAVLDFWRHRIAPVPWRGMVMTESMTSRSRSLKRSIDTSRI